MTGSRAFIDSVLSRLKDLLLFENDETRLQAVYRLSADRENGKQLKIWNCCVQVHERGASRTAAAKKKGRQKK